MDTTAPIRFRQTDDQRLLPPRTLLSPEQPRRRPPRRRSLAPEVHPRRLNRGPEQGVGVADDIPVALPRQEPLPVSGVLGVEGVSRDHRVEERASAAGLW